MLPLLRRRRHLRRSLAGAGGGDGGNFTIGELAGSDAVEAGLGEAEEAGGAVELPLELLDLPGPVLDQRRQRFLIFVTVVAVCFFIGFVAVFVLDPRLLRRRRRIAHRRLRQPARSAAGGDIRGGWGRKAIHVGRQCEEGDLGRMVILRRRVMGGPFCIFV